MRFHLARSGTVELQQDFVYNTRSLLFSLGTLRHINLTRRYFFRCLQSKRFDGESQSEQRDNRFAGNRQNETPQKEELCEERLSTTLNHRLLAHTLCK